MKMINGQEVPQHLSMGELEQMLTSSDMQTFALACEALRIHATHEAYLLLKAHIEDKDLYRRRYVMSVIFDWEEASELKQELLHDLKSDHHFLVDTALNNLIYEKIRVEDDAIFSCIERNHRWLDGYYYQVLALVDKNESNLARIIKLFQSCDDPSARITIAERLPAFCTAENYQQIFAMTANDPQPRIRMAACCIAHYFGRMDLLQPFADDPDGHIRNYALRASAMK